MCHRLGNALLNGLCLQLVWKRLEGSVVQGGKVHWWGVPSSCMVFLEQLDGHRALVWCTQGHCNGTQLLIIVCTEVATQLKQDVSECIHIHNKQPTRYLPCLFHIMVEEMAVGLVPAASSSAMLLQVCSSLSRKVLWTAPSSWRKLQPLQHS